MSTIALLHPGDMGAGVAREMRRNGHTVRWCPAGRGAATRQRAEAAGLVAVPELAELCRDADIVLSLCPPAAAEDVARQVAESGFRGIFVEANAISPDTLHRIVPVLGPATVVDGAIIGPPPRSHRTGTRLHLSGDPDAAQRVAELVAGTLVEPSVLDHRLGSASALKMSFASFQKASRVLAAVAHALADQHGVSEALSAEAKRMPGKILEHRDYLPSVAARAWRWEPELREIARTLDDAELPSVMANGAADVLAMWADDRDATDVAATLERLRTR